MFETGLKTYILGSLLRVLSCEALESFQSLIASKEVHHTRSDKSQACINKAFVHKRSHRGFIKVKVCL